MQSGAERVAAAWSIKHGLSEPLRKRDSDFTRANSFEAKARGVALFLKSQSCQAHVSFFASKLPKLQSHK